MQVMQAVTDSEGYRHPRARRRSKQLSVPNINLPSVQGGQISSPGSPRPLQNSNAFAVLGNGSGAKSHIQNRVNGEIKSPLNSAPGSPLGRSPSSAHKQKHKRKHNRAPLEDCKLPNETRSSVQNNNEHLSSFDGMISDAALSTSSQSIIAPTPLRVIPTRPFDNTTSTITMQKPPGLLRTLSGTMQRPKFTLLDYLKEQITASDLDSGQDFKKERVANFLNVPWAIEKMMVFGYCICLDSFLYNFTIFPTRVAIALWCLFNSLIDEYVSSKEEKRHLSPAQKCDLMKGLLVVLACISLKSVDPSRVYHSIRQQNMVKLYVIFNVLEIADKLCCSFGGDILDALFSKSILAQPPSDESVAKRYLRLISLFTLALAYVLAHTYVLYYQMITLNVAINSFSNALLSLLISNQFVEIKGGVFKKFEKENLFQLTCSDIVERFQLSVFLLIIFVRNCYELSGLPPSPDSVLPSTFVPILPTQLGSLLTPMMMVLGSEILVDWLKHAFITRFNQIRPSVYGRFTDVLCRDLVAGSGGKDKYNNTLVDQSPAVSSRIGFASLPNACLVIRMAIQLLYLMESPFFPVDPVTAARIPSYGITFKELISLFQTRDIIKIWQTLQSWNWIDRLHMWQWLENLLRWGMVGGFVVVGFACLVAIKLLLGINLHGYAYKRYTNMERREREEKQKEEEMKAMGKDEKEYHTNIRTFLNNDTKDNLYGVSIQKFTLDNVSRFDMVRSRIP